jgi:threonine synthase
VFIGVGDGSVISALCKGFDELSRLGLIDRAPRVVGVQAEGSAPIAAAFSRYRGGVVEFDDVEASTVADSICVGKPRDVVKAVTYVARNGGTFVTVNDEEILDAILSLARATGVFAEPAGAASYAGLLRLARAGTLEGKSAAVIVSGNGLKDVASARRRVGSPIQVDPTIKEIERHL